MAYKGKTCFHTPVKDICSCFKHNINLILLNFSKKLDLFIISSNWYLFGKDKNADEKNIRYTTLVAWLEEFKMFKCYIWDYLFKL